MDLEMNFRDARESDLPAIEALVNSSYRGESSKKGWTTEADLLDGQRTDLSNLQEMLRKSGATIVVIENDHHHLIGCAYLEQKYNICYLGMLTINPLLQGQGAGKKLLHECEHRARKNGFQFLQITVIANRKELIAWYERYGFKKTGKTAPFPYDDQKFGVPKVKDLFFEVLEKPL